MKFRNVLLTLLIISSLTLAQDRPAAETEKPKLGDPAPEITGLKWIKKGPIEMKKGSIYVIEFWATWCGPCKVSIPHLTEVQKKFRDKNVTVIGISNENAATVEPFVKDMGEKMDYAVAVDANGFATRDYMRAFEQSGIPTAFIVDKETRLVWFGHPLGGLDKVLEQVINGSFDVEAHRKKIEEEKKLIGYAMKYFDTITSQGPEQAAETGRQIVKEAPADFLSEFATVILTRLPKDKRDLTLAVQAAQKANQLTEGKDFSMLNTYAFALYESASEQMLLAAEYQKKAIEVSDKNNEQMQEALKKTLEKYEKAAKLLAEIRNETQ